MSRTTKLSDRMKRYEQTTDISLPLKTPAIIRIDGRAFHTFTRGLKRPFDEILMKSMQETMLALCEEIQGCVLGYTQSDEISLVLVDYQTVKTAAWFDYRAQKCASIAASKATKHFNRIFSKYANEWIEDYYEAWNTSDEEEKYSQALKRCMEEGAEFDARIFPIPVAEVCNYMYWRQDDATRNSIQMLGRAYFSKKEMDRKNNNQVQDMLFINHGVNWNNCSIPQKRGSCCIRVEREYLDKDNNTFKRKKWIIDREIPIFIGEDRKYIDNLINLD
mgnify:CR=1 FL=1